MLNINSYIFEKLQIGSKTKILGPQFEKIYNEKKKLCVTEKELNEIEIYTNSLPVCPKYIKTGLQGNIKLIFDKTFYSWGKDHNYSISISKPTRYEGSFKITMDVGNARPYEFPMGNNNHKDKNGNLKLPDIKSIFDHINKIWDKYNLTTKLK